MINSKNREYNNIFVKDVCQKLRNNMTAPEIILWQKIRDKQINGLKFRRQYSIDNFVVDFFCPKLKLAIELDGNSHYNNAAVQKDHIRDSYLQSKGIVILRFTNDEVMENINGVMDGICKYHTTPGPS